MTRPAGGDRRPRSRRRQPAPATEPAATARPETAGTDGAGPASAPDVPAWVSEVDDLLSRAACELVLAPGGHGAAIGPMLARISATLAAAGIQQLAALAARIEAARTAPIDVLADSFAQIQSAWNVWKTSASESVATAEGADAPAAAAAADPELAMLAGDSELATMFMAEALDHLATIETLVLQVEAHPGDARLLNDIFRPFHTIKGNAGALGVTSIQEVAHSIENLLDLARAGRHAIGAAEIEVILRGVDLLAAMVKSLPVRLAGGIAPAVGPACAALIAEVDALVRDAAVTGTVALPSVWPDPAPSGTTGPAAAAPPVPDAPPARSDGSLTAVRVDTRKLDALVDIVGELVIVQSIIQADPALQQRMDDRLARNLGQLRRITSDLQRSAMSMRMMPIRPTFQKTARLVRDLGRRAGKPVELVMSGDDTELDRKVVEEITDPLMHMVRNSIDHGIEPPDVRRAAGKPVPARVTLSASHEGGSIVIGIADDGAGLDTERIRARAVSLGLVRDDAMLSPAEIHELIFRPGFSTAAQVTALSGRGVGMDVVRRNIESLRGRIEIQTTRGAGTQFTIRLPLTLAILEGLLLRAGRERFVLPTFCVRESLRPARGQVHGFQGQQVIQVRDSVLPLVHLAGLFGIGGSLPDPAEATVVVIEDNGRRIGIVVDELLGKQEVVIKSLGEAFGRVRGVAGGAILGDGRVGLILDAGGLVALLDRPLEHAA